MYVLALALALALAFARARVCMICMAPVGTATSNGMRIELLRTATDNFESVSMGQVGHVH